MVKTMRYDITDEELRIGAAEYRESMLVALHESFGQDYEHSAKNEETAREIVRINKKKRHSHLVLKRIAIVLLCMFISAGTVLSLSEEARAFVSGWLREILRDKIIYHFIGKDNGEPIPKCRLGWIPEGFVETERYEDDSTIMIVIGDKSENKILFEADRIGTLDKTILDIGIDNMESIQVNGVDAEYYPPQFEGDTCNLFWTDEIHNVVCQINSILSKDDTIRIAENIKFHG